MWGNTLRTVINLHVHHHSLYSLNTILSSFKGKKYGSSELFMYIGDEQKNKGNFTKVTVQNQDYAQESSETIE